MRELSFPMENTVATKDPVRRACNSSGLAAGDKLGREPKPSQAKPWLPPSSTPPVVRDLAYAQSLLHGFPRRLRSTLGRSGSAYRSAGSVYQVGASLSFVRGKQPLQVGDVGETRGLILHCWLYGTQPSRATCCSAPGLLGSAFHTACSYARRLLNRHREPSGTRLYSGQNSISCGRETAASRLRNECNSRWSSFPLFSEKVS